MAKYLLWFMFIFTLIAVIVQSTNNQPVELYTKILLWSILSVIAICESIEKIAK